MTVPSVYDRMCWPEAQFEQALATGEHRRELTAWWGEDEYLLLSGLARHAAAAKQRPEEPVLYVLPGILGSQLGIARGEGEPPDVLWLDPDDVVHGRLTELHPQHASEQRSLGAVIYNYLSLKLRLVAAGYRVVVYDYDWREDVLASGRLLAERIHREGSPQVVLIGHSMGGLLARATVGYLEQDGSPQRVRQIIGLGTPHGGSIAAVQALRAAYPVVCRLAALDAHHDAYELTNNVFRYFLSLYQMLPAGTPGLDLFDLDCWPRTGTEPLADLLARAREFRARLAPVDTRLISIVGTGQRTVTGIERAGDEFRYQITSAGDGTVAITRASVEGAASYSVRCEHSELPRSATVAEAIVDLVRTGHTRRLQSGVVERPGPTVHLTDSMIAQELGAKVDWHHLSVQQRRQYLDRLSAPPASYRTGPRRTAGTHSAEKL